MNISTQRHLDRRTFLRGLGVTMALPMLDAMRPAFAAGAPAPKRRMVAICTMLGIHPPHLYPEQTGRGYTASKYSQVIDELRDHFTIFSGLSHPEVDGGHSSEASFLTAAAHPGSSSFRNTISLDQFAAERIGNETRYASLSLATETRGLSWTRGGVAIPAENRPSQIFARLFLEGSKTEMDQQVRRLRDGQSIMDTVGTEAKSLQRSLGMTDRDKLDQYFTSVRELEQRLVKAELWTQRPKPQVAMKQPVDPARKTDFLGYARPYFDMVHLALQTDSTRLVTIGLNGMNAVPEIAGVTQAWHALSHHGKDPSKIDELAVVEMAELKELREFLTKLKSSTEEGESLLDRTMVLYGSNLGNANSHDNRNLPVLLAGGGFKHGQHLAFDPNKNPPLANLYVQMLQRLGIEEEKFGSGVGAGIPGFA